MQATLAFGEPPSEGDIGSIEVWLDATGRRPALGIDEAGRGPLAGPVTAAAVCLPSLLPASLATLNDSKKLSEAQRERLFEPIQACALAFGIASVDAPRIDVINILEATREAMRLAAQAAVAMLGRAPATLLVDGNLRLPGWVGEQWALVKGDGRSVNIAAASVLAKVTRDRMMVAAARTWPVYGFERHKGYGTLAHRQALGLHGPCSLHRRSFKYRPVPPEPPAQ
ncbi:MAG: ribonuclease HII [Bradymonadia bacterium]